MVLPFSFKVTHLPWYFFNGTVFRVIHYINGKVDDEYVENYENGKPHIKCIYLNGKREGDYSEFYPGGQPFITGKYLNGKKTGKWVTLN